MKVLLRNMACSTWGTDPMDTQRSLKEERVRFLGQNRNQAAKETHPDHQKT